MRMERVAMYVLALDAINFCFWPVDDSIVATKNGLEYEHLAMALRMVAEADNEVGPFDLDGSFHIVYEVAARCDRVRLA